MKTITTKIWGLDLLLGGGIKLVERFDGESAVLLVRGSPGTGKTLFAMQLATAMSEGTNADIAYACVELLPPELREQWTSFSRATPFFESPFPETITQSASSVFAGLLDLGEAGEEPKNLESSLKNFISQLRKMGRKPGVLVVDSLSDGYGLGTKLVRHKVDSICKLAVTEGLCLILIEETPDYVPSYWSFAVDTVFELSLEREGHNEYQRMLTIRKHRFGATDPGPHRMEFVPSKGIDVLPRVSAYATSMVKEQLSQYTPEHFWKGIDQRWNIKEVDKKAGWPEPRGSVFAIYGREAFVLKRAVTVLADVSPPGQHFQDAIIEFSEATHDKVVLRCNPYTTGEAFLADTFSFLRSGRDLLFRRVLIGDFRALRNFHHGQEILRAVGLLIGYLRRWRIPAILFETVSSPRTVTSGDSRSVSTEKVVAPAIVDFADASIELELVHEENPSRVSARIEDQRKHQRTHGTLSWS